MIPSTGLPSYDLIIIGAGIIGLATAHQLLEQNPGLSLLILEKEADIALHQSGNNSGVVHSGIYYKPGSLKAKNCIEGKRELLQFCEQQGVAYQKLSKIIVATEQKEIAALHDIAARGKENGVELEIMGPQRVAEIEPHVKALQAILVPDCHIIDYREVAKALAKNREIRCNEKVVQIRQEKGICFVETINGTLSAKRVINCAALFSGRIAKMKTPRILPFRGEYYSIKKTTLVNGLVYPVPNPLFPFLGVHLTRRIDGGVEAGPNAVLERGVDYLNYAGFWKMAARYWKVGAYELYRSASRRAFLKSVQKLVPEVASDDLGEKRFGVRAQMVTKEGKLFDDFSFHQEGNILHVLNAPSPGATACLSIGRMIARKVLA